MHLINVEAGKKHHHVGNILGKPVGSRIWQPVAAATPDDIRAKNAVVR